MTLLRKTTLTAVVGAVSFFCVFAPLVYWSVASAPGHHEPAPSYGVFLIGYLAVAYAVAVFTLVAIAYACASVINYFRRRS